MQIQIEIEKMRRLRGWEEKLAMQKSQADESFSNRAHHTNKQSEAIPVLPNDTSSNSGSSSTKAHLTNKQTKISQKCQVLNTNSDTSYTSDTSDTSLTAIQESLKQDLVISDPD